MFKTYEEVIEWLFVQLPNYQSQGASAYKPGLDNISALLDGISNPQEKIETIHIAGTNGKGSVAHMLAAIYQSNEYKVGIFTSPHIADFRERIKVNGELISKDFVLNFVNQHRELIDTIGATFFEINTAMAFKAFADEAVDIAIIETGLGGRLDSTNVLKPKLSVITSIGIDHAEFLGDSLREIAKEKGGIIKPNIPVVIGAEQVEVVEELSLIAIDKKAEIHYPDHEAYEIDLLGMYQQSNAGIAVKAAQVIRTSFPLDDEKIAYGLSHISELTGLKGRFQLLQREPIVIMDAAHNPAGIKGLLNEINELSFEKLHMVYGSSNDKDLNAVFEVLPQEASYYFTEFESKRSTQSEKFNELAVRHHLNHSIFKDPKDALSTAISASTSKDLIMIFGSFYMMDKFI
jgi:dihydrofolate synthase/folylpolyglutamate synthase